MGKNESNSKSRKGQEAYEIMNEMVKQKRIVGMGKMNEMIKKKRKARRHVKE